MQGLVFSPYIIIHIIVVKRNNSKLRKIEKKYENESHLETKLSSILSMRRDFIKFYVIKGNDFS
jgi:hypothetical protein